MNRAKEQLGPAKIESRWSDKWRRTAAAGLIGTVAFMAPGLGRADQNPPTTTTGPTTEAYKPDPAFMTAALEDGGNTADPLKAQQIMDEARDDGFNTVIETEIWEGGRSHPVPEDLQAAQVSVAAAEKDGIEIMMRVIPDPNHRMPTTATD